MIMIMICGVGGLMAEVELVWLDNMFGYCQFILVEEYKDCILVFQVCMFVVGLDVVYIDVGSNLIYYMGIKWYQIECLMGVVILVSGDIIYVGLVFEDGMICDFMMVEVWLEGWQEYEDFYVFIVSLLVGCGKVGLDFLMLLFWVMGFKVVCDVELVDVGDVILFVCFCKLENELVLMQVIKVVMLEVYKVVVCILCEGIMIVEVIEFIYVVYKKIGVLGGLIFCIVLFGLDSVFLYGVFIFKMLESGDMVLIDIGCVIYGYQFDIICFYVFGELMVQQCWVWEVEKVCQFVVFDVVQLGQFCLVVDDVVWVEGECCGFGLGYQLLGMLYCIGYGIGLDIYEGFYLVGNDRILLDIGMCFFNELMICVLGEFGICLEDYFYMVVDGLCWFIQFSKLIDDLFGQDLLCLIVV